MALDDQQLARIRAEFEEMPGMRLTLAQACRLWQLDGTACCALLEQLVADGFLHRTHDGVYIALAGVRPRPAKMSLPAPQPVGAPSRRRA